MTLSAQLISGTFPEPRARKGTERTIKPPTHCTLNLTGGDAIVVRYSEGVVLVSPSLPAIPPLLVSRLIPEQQSKILTSLPGTERLIECLLNYLNCESKFRLE